MVFFHVCEYNETYYGFYASGIEDTTKSAKKALSVINKNNENLIDQEIEFKLLYINENKLKVTFFKGKKSKLDSPKIFKHNNIIITHEINVIQIKTDKYVTKKNIKSDFYKKYNVGDSFSIDSFIIDNDYVTDIQLQ